MRESTAADRPDAPKRQLTLFDSTCIIVGIIIGAGIYQMAPDVARGASCWWGVLLIWLIGGLLSLFGALAYAELATAYPQEGGDYVYLGRAYGPWAGFLFGWMQLLVVRPGDIATMALIFATYAQTIYDPLHGLLPGWTLRQYAVAPVLLLTAVNVWGVRQGKWTQNLLTVVKALGLLAIVAVAMLARRASALPASVEGLPVSLALIFVLFTYGGWNEMAYVAAEIKDPRRGILRALVLGTLAVTALYLLINGAFLYALGYSGLANSQAVAVATVATVFPSVGARLIGAIVCISALGAVNGLIFTGARISYAVGADHRLFRGLGQWSRGRGTPVQALLLQGILAAGLILALGDYVETIIYVAAPVYLFYLATTLSVIVLRLREPRVERPYRMTGYPVTTLIFAAVCGLLIYSAVMYKPFISGVALGVMLLGIPVYLFDRRHATPPSGSPPPAEDSPAPR